MKLRLNRGIMALTAVAFISIGAVGLTTILWTSVAGAAAGAICLGVLIYIDTLIGRK